MDVTVTKQYVKKDFYDNTENAAYTGDSQTPSSGGSSGGDIFNSSLYYTSDETDDLLDGKVNIVGTPANGELAVWTGATGIEGDSSLLWDGSDLDIVGGLIVTTGIDMSESNSLRWYNADSSPDLLHYISGGSTLRIQNNTNSSLTQIYGKDTGGAISSLFVGNPDADVALYYDGSYKFKTQSDGAIINGKVAHPGFSSGFQGSKWSINSDGDGEFEDLVVRGSMSVYELILNQVRYQDGGLIIGAGGGKVRSVDDATQGAETLTLEDPEGNGVIPFTVGAIVLVQDFDLNRTSVIKKIVRQVSAINSNGSIDFTTTTGWLIGADTGVYQAGDTLVAIGHVSDTNLDANIYMSAVDSGNPFLRMMDGVTSYAKWSLSDKTAMKLQLGNLAALANYDIVPASPGYGLYCDNVFLTGKIVAASGEVGGWVIGATSLEDSTGLVGMSSAVTGGDDVRFWAGHTTPTSAPFYVTESGILQATSGTIGGWTLDTDAIYTGAKSTGDGFNIESAGGLTLAADGGIHGENFYINSDGSVGISDVTIRTSPESSSILTIEGQHIYDSGDTALGFLAINLKGKDGGYTQYRQTVIGDGKNNAMVYFTGSGPVCTFEAPVNITTRANLSTSTTSTLTNSTNLQNNDVMIWTGAGGGAAKVLGTTNIGTGKRVTIINTNISNITITGKVAATVNGYTSRTFTFDGTDWYPETN